MQVWGRAKGLEIKAVLAPVLCGVMTRLGSRATIVRAWSLFSWHGVADLSSLLGLSHHVCLTLLWAALVQHVTLGGNSAKSKCYLFVFHLFGAYKSFALQENCSFGVV